MKNFKEDYTFVDLTHHELINIDGGAPTAETSFWYDLSWTAVTIGKIYIYHKFGVKIS